MKNRKKFNIIESIEKGVQLIDSLKKYTLSATVITKNLKNCLNELAEIWGEKNTNDNININN